MTFEAYPVLQQLILPKVPVLQNLKTHPGTYPLQLKPKVLFPVWQAEIHTDNSPTCPVYNYSGFIGEFVGKK